LTLGIEYYGLEHVPATGPALIVSNHQSYLDPLLVGAALPRSVPSTSDARTLVRSRPAFTTCAEANW
jgi:1-acyl-sn-glycerol-3-phosphate acyltransferase